MTILVMTIFSCIVTIAWHGYGAIFIINFVQSYVSILDLRYFTELYYK